MGPATQCEVAVRRIRYSSNICRHQLAEDLIVRVRRPRPRDGTTHGVLVLPCKTVFALLECRRTQVTRAHTGPLHSSPATLAPVGTMFYMNVRAIWCSSLPSCAGRLSLGWLSSTTRSRVGRRGRGGRGRATEGMEPGWSVACGGWKGERSIRSRDCIHQQMRRWRPVLVEWVGRG